MVNNRAKELAILSEAISQCSRCDRLVEWREQVAANPRASFRGEKFWARGVPGFGDIDAEVVIVGLAPAAHGANRTGRMFTGDRSGDFLYASLYRTGFANQPTSIGRDDGLELKNCYVLSAVRCAPPDNKPTIDERDNCSGFFTSELALLTGAKVYIALGSYGWDAMLRWQPIRPKPKFTHGAEVKLADGSKLIGCFHPSQQNTFTGKLTEEMIDNVFNRAGAIIAK